MNVFLERIDKQSNRLRSLIDKNDYVQVKSCLSEYLHPDYLSIREIIYSSKPNEKSVAAIAAFNKTLISGLEYVADSASSQKESKENKIFFKRLSRSIGRSALMLSGGAGFIYMHHGVIQELINNNLLPRVLSGSSAGSWLCAQVGTRTNEELQDNFIEYARYDLPLHLNPFRVLMGMEENVTAETVKQGALDSIYTDMTFGEAYEHSGRYINISVAPSLKHQEARLLNAITSPNVYIRSAIDASGSVPGLVRPVGLYERGLDGKPKPYLSKSLWFDGSVSHDLPFNELSRLYGVNTKIVSMINPIILPFISSNQTNRNDNVIGRTFLELVKGVGKKTMRTLESITDLIGAKKLAPALLFGQALLDQDYSGDIYIVPDRKRYKWIHALFSYNEDEIRGLVQAGKEATHPHIHKVRLVTEVSATIDKIRLSKERRVQV